MNREERRKAAKRGITEADLNTAYNNGVNETVNQLSYIVALVLHDKLNMSNENVEYAIDEIIDQFDSIVKNYMTILDVKRIVKEEIGINFIRE